MKYQRKPKKWFYVEYTDLFGGERNYSWVNRFKVWASTPMGAVRKVAVVYFRKVDEETFNSVSGCTGYYVTEFDNTCTDSFLKIEIVE